MIAHILTLLALFFTGYQYDPQALVEWAGCRGPVITSEWHSAVESGYSPQENAIYFGTGDLDRIPGRGVIILLHEAAHCLQNQDGTLAWSHRRDPTRYELDADRQAVDIACRLGYNGRQLGEETLRWLQVQYQYDGDANHGTIDQRVNQGLTAWSCQAPQAA